MDALFLNHYMMLQWAKRSIERLIWVSAACNVVLKHWELIIKIAPHGGIWHGLGFKCSHDVQESMSVWSHYDTNTLKHHDYKHFFPFMSSDYCCHVVGSSESQGLLRKEDTNSKCFLSFGKKKKQIIWTVCDRWRYEWVQTVAYLYVFIIRVLYERIML